MSENCKDFKISEKDVLEVGELETRAFSHSTFPLNGTHTKTNLNLMESIHTRDCSSPCGFEFNHCQRSQPNSVIMPILRKPKSSQVQQAMHAEPVARNWITLNEMKSFVLLNHQWTKLHSLVAIFEQLILDSHKWINFDSRRDVMQIGMKIFEIANCSKKELRSLITPEKYESFFRMVFAWQDPFMCFELVCMEFEYSKRVSKNFQVLIKFLTDNLLRLDPHTYLRLFIRLTYIVSLKFKAFEMSLKNLGSDVLKFPKSQSFILKQLEKLQEFKELIKMNKIELFREETEHPLIEKVPQLIHKALKLTGEFPFSNFEIINKNLARIFFLYCSNSTKISEDRFWNSLTYSINMFPEIPLKICSGMVNKVVRKVLYLKVYHHLIWNSNSNYKISKKQKVLKAFRFHCSRNKYEIPTETLEKIEKFSCYKEEKYEMILKEEQEKLANYIDPKLFIFKKLITCTLNAFYFLETLILKNPSFEQVDLLNSVLKIYRDFLKMCVEMGAKIIRHSKMISLNSTDILKFLDFKTKISTFDKRNLMMTVQKIKKAYESVFIIMGNKRKLFNFIKFSQREKDSELYQAMNQFIY